MSYQLFYDNPKVDLHKYFKLIFYDKMKIHVLHLLNAIEYAQVRGISKGYLIEQKEKPPTSWQSETAMVSVDDFYKIIEIIQKELYEDGLGIRLGNFFNLQALGLIHQISLQTTTIEEALYYLQSFTKTTFPILNLSMEVSESNATITLSIDNQHHNVNSIIIETLMTIIDRELVLMATSDLKINKTSPNTTDKYPKNWQFNDNYSISFTSNILKANFQDRAKQQLQYLVPEYLKLIESFKTDDTFGAKTKLMSLHLAKPELPNLEMVADAFCLSPRTFQRRLSVENQSFRDIMNELRKQIASLLIRHNRFTIADISYILGYSEPAAFIHSFKKWFGDSPERMRNLV
jgi:AraC-like DNA-binding protein